MDSENDGMKRKYLSLYHPRASVGQCEDFFAKALAEPVRYSKVKEGQYYFLQKGED